MSVPIYEMPGQYQTLYNVMNGASFSDINSFASTAITGFTTLQANLQGIQGALGREETWDSTSCANLIASFDTMNSGLSGVLSALPGKCSGAAGALEAVAAAVVKYKQHVDDYNTLAEQYNTKEANEPTKTKKVYTTTGTAPYQTTTSRDVETDEHKDWVKDLNSMKTQLDGMKRTITETESNLAGLVAAAKAACGPI